MATPKKTAPAAPVEHVAELRVMPAPSLRAHIRQVFQLEAPVEMKAHGKLLEFALKTYAERGIQLFGLPGAQGPAPMKRVLIPNRGRKGGQLPRDAASALGPDSSLGEPHPRYLEWPDLPAGQEYRVVIEVQPMGDKNARPWISPGVNGVYCQIVSENQVAIKPAFLEVIENAVHGEQVIREGQEAGESREFRAARDFHFTEIGDVIYDSRAKRIVEWVSQAPGRTPQLPRSYQSHLDQQ